MAKPDLDLPITSKAATPEFRSGWDAIWGKTDDSARNGDILPDSQDDVCDNTDAGGST